MTLDKENEILKERLTIVIKKLLSVKPELQGWIEKNFSEMPNSVISDLDYEERLTLERMKNENKKSST